MLPRDAAKTTITLYNYLRLKQPHEEEPPVFTYKKTVLPDCVWQQDAEATYEKTGKLDADAVKLLIPYYPDYFSVQNGEVFRGTGWTVEIGPEVLSSYIVKGECQFNFPPPIFEQGEPVTGGGPQGGHPSPADFLRQYIQPFETTVKYKKPKEIIEYFTGSRSLWYIEVRC